MKLYLEKSGTLDDPYAEAIQRVKEAWENMQFAVGAVLMSNVQDIDSWARMWRERRSTRWVPSCCSWWRGSAVSWRGCIARLPPRWPTSGACCTGFPALVARHPRRRHEPGIFAGSGVPSISYDYARSQPEGRAVPLRQRTRGGRVLPFQLPSFGAGDYINGLPGTNMALPVAPPPLPSIHATDYLSSLPGQNVGAIPRPSSSRC